MTMKASIRKSFTWCAAHRLLYHNGKCAHNHGHNYTAEIEVFANISKVSGMVRDFADLNPLKAWIDRTLDHGTVLNPDDEAMIDFCTREEQKLYIMPKDIAEPTAEHLAVLLLRQTRKIVELGGTLHGVNVTVHETEKCSATITWSQEVEKKQTPLSLRGEPDVKTKHWTD